MRGRELEEGHHDSVTFAEELRRVDSGGRAEVKSEQIMALPLGASKTKRLKIKVGRAIWQVGVWLSGRTY